MDACYCKFHWSLTFSSKVKINYSYVLFLIVVILCKTVYKYICILILYTYISVNIRVWVYLEEGINDLLLPFEQSSCFKPQEPRVNLNLFRNLT